MIELVGVLPVDKPEGPTSHDVVAMARRGLRTRAIGHTGTLDPFASGLLLLCVGSATRIAEYLVGLPKTYQATIRLGWATDTDDRTGEPISESAPPGRMPRPEAVADALAGQVGTLQQLPPRFSAKKVEGERLHRAARRGETLQAAPVAVTVYRLAVVAMRLPEVAVEVECSSGTYIRAIARDVGSALGVGAHLSALRRTRVGTHEVAGAVPTNRLGDAEVVASALLPPARALAHLHQLVIDDPAQARQLAHGIGVTLPAASSRRGADGPVALIGPDGSLLAIAAVAGEVVRPRKVFVRPEA